MAHNVCILHLKETLESLKDFTLQTFATFITSRKSWLSLYGDQKNVALGSQKIFSADEEERYDEEGTVEFE